MSYKLAETRAKRAGYGVAEESRYCLNETKHYTIAVGSEVTLKKGESVTVEIPNGVLAKDKKTPLVCSVTDVGEDASLSIMVWRH